MSEQEQSAMKLLRDSEGVESRLKNEISKRRGDAIAEIDKQLRAEYDEPLRLAATKRYEAQKALDDARIAEWASRGPAVGTRYLEWNNDRYSREAIRTGRVAVVEQRTNETRLPDNVRWCLPIIGDKFLRILKKDGTPGLQFVALSDWKWKPEADE